MIITPTGERQLQECPQDEREDAWIYHDVAPSWVGQAKLHGLTVTAPCGYTFKPRTPPSIKSPSAPGGSVMTVRLDKCPMCADLNPRFARQEEYWQVSL